MTHWASEWIGRPWVAGESDCWMFARAVWRARWGLDLPEVPVDVTDPRAGRRAIAAGRAQGWVEVADPVEGDAALMALGRAPCHVGIWCATPEGAGVLHSVQGIGSIFTLAGDLARLRYRVTGFYRPEGMV